MARLYVIRWAFIFLRLTKFQEKKIPSRCFKFDDLNIELAEAIEILKATAQRFGKSEIAAFWNNENSLYYFKMFLIYCTWVELLFPYKDRFGSQCHLPLLSVQYLSSHHPGVIFHVKVVNDLGFIFTLLKLFYRLYILYFDFWFLDFEYLKRPHIVFFCFLWGYERNKSSVMNDYYSNQN